VSETEAQQVDRSEPSSPNRDPVELLSPFERFAFRTLRWLNGPAYKLGLFWQIFFLFPFLWIFMGRRLVVRGLERLDALPKDAPFLLVANHRTFFDLFVLGWILVARRRLRYRVSFPVRANFFYENPLGLFFCLFFSGGAMFPPIFRSPQKRAFNQFAVGLLVQRLREPRNMVGFHPEGTRGRTGDPYALLPAQPGGGKLVLDARPMVVPAFVTGLSNSLVTELLANLRKRKPVVAIFGEPIPPDGWPEGSRLALQKRVSDELLEKIRALQPEERAVRASL
jgi:1-acyl-sn-glycerol-3-phosphate acyltransferase